MSYNIFNKNASFQGDTSGSIENQVNDWDTQTISGNKTFTASITSSADVMLSGSGKISASFFYGDGTGLSGVGGTAAGADRQIQFNDGGTNFGASANLTFTAANIVSVNGQVSASQGITASTFHGDGSNLTAVTASFVTATNVHGTLNASQINLGNGLEDNSNAVQINLSSSTSGLGLTANGLAVDVSALGSDASFATSKAIIVQDGSNFPKKMELGTIQSGLSIAGGQLTGQMSTARLPDTVSVVNVTASGHVSASTFHGDGSALVGVTSTPNPAGSNTQIQFNSTGVIAGNANLTFLTASSTLATTIVSASAHVSASAFANGSGTLIDSQANFQGNNAYFDQITASSDISSSGDVYATNFRGNGSNLTGLPVASYSDYTANRILAAGAASDAIKGVAQVTFNNPTLSVVGNVSASTNILAGQAVTASTFHTKNGITAPGGGGSNLQFLDSNGNVTAGGIEMVSDGSLVLNFNDNSISGSGHVSASAFVGDGSQLTNVPATPQFRYYQVRGYVATHTPSYFNPHQTGGGNSPTTLPVQKFTAPGDGSIVRWIFTPATETEPIPPGQTVITFFNKNSNANANSGTATAHVTGALDRPITIGGFATSGSIVDWTGTNLTVSGSNSFSAGDQLLFGFNISANIGDTSVCVILKIDESITYG